MIILSICICSLEKRLATLHILMRHLDKQMQKFPGQVELLVETDNGAIPTGTKRNILYRKAQGKYVCSIDDDDWVPDWYIETILKAVQTDPDTVGFHGVMTTHGQNPEGFFISKFNPYLTQKKNGKRNHYLRYTNHLSPIRTTIALQFPFEDIYWEEDFKFATALHEAKALKTEVIINRSMYEYRYIRKKS